MSSTPSGRSYTDGARMLTCAEVERAVLIELPTPPCGCATHELADLVGVSEARIRRACNSLMIQQYVTVLRGQFADDGRECSGYALRRERYSEVLAMFRVVQEPEIPHHA